MIRCKFAPFLLLLILAFAEAIRAEDISGVISATRIITNDSQLVGNVS